MKTVKLLADIIQIEMTFDKRVSIALFFVLEIKNNLSCKKILKKLNLNQTINFLKYKFFINSFFMIHFGKRIPLKFRASEIFA